MDENEHLDALEKEAEALERRSQDVAREIEQARSDWRSKQSDQSVPGAAPPLDETQGEDTDDDA